MEGGKGGDMSRREREMEVGVSVLNKVWVVSVLCAASVLCVVCLVYGEDGGQQIIGEGDKRGAMHVDVPAVLASSASSASQQC